MKLSASSVCCGIVSFNPDDGRLRQNISSVVGQVSEVIVFDNGSSNVESVLSVAASNDRVSVLPSKDNLGMAFALNALAEEAISRNYSCILFLDQDSVAGPGMVESQIELMSEDVGIVCPCVVDRNALEAEDWFQSQEETNFTITSGSLVNLSAYEAIGGYDERLFVDWVDFDFCHNLRLHDYRIVRAGKAELVHELGRKEYALSLPRKTPDGKWRMRKYYRTNHSLFREEDKARSQTIVLAKYRHTRVCRRALIPVLSDTFFTFLLEKHRFEILKARLRGRKRGLEELDKKAE